MHDNLTGADVSIEEGLKGRTAGTAGERVGFQSDRSMRYR
jgi:hypothetical protein